MAETEKDALTGKTISRLESEIDLLMNTAPA